MDEIKQNFTIKEAEWRKKATLCEEEIAMSNNIITKTNSQWKEATHRINNIAKNQAVMTKKNDKMKEEYEKKLEKVESALKNKIELLIKVMNQKKETRKNYIRGRSVDAGNNIRVDK